MNRPVDIACPCDFGAYQREYGTYGKKSCGSCSNVAPWGKCLGDRGWAFMALAAAEVARERGDDAQR